MNFLERPSGGSVIFNGVIIQNNQKQIRELRRKVSMVFQEFNLFEMKDVLTNITLAPVLSKKMSKVEATAEAFRVLKFVGLEEKAYALPDTLSGGEKQRVAIARALAMQPQMLLMDEPTSALDPELIQEVLKVIRMLANQNVTMVIVTHQLDFAREIADRLLFMEMGQIIEEGTPEEVLRHPQKQRTLEFVQSIITNDI